jgi:hypothetical protein
VVETWCLYLVPLTVSFTLLLSGRTVDVRCLISHKNPQAMAPRDWKWNLQLYEVLALSQTCRPVWFYLDPKSGDAIGQYFIFEVFDRTWGFRFWTC